MNYFMFHPNIDREVANTKPPPATERSSDNLSFEKANNIGEVAEWSKALVLKTRVWETAPWVRIPPSPPICDFVRNGKMWSVAKRHSMPRAHYSELVQNN